jgi:hypothetical protein
LLQLLSASVTIWHLPCVLCLSCPLFFMYDTFHIGSGSIWHPLNKSHLETPYFQIRSQSGLLTEHAFLRDTCQSGTPSKRHKTKKKKKRKKTHTQIPGQVEQPSLTCITRM